MESLQKLWEQLLATWRHWTTGQRLLVGGGAAVCLSVVVAVGFWASRPEFVTLADHLSPAESAEVVSALEAAGIEYRLNFAGSAVLVPRSALSRARMATKEIIAAAPSESAAGSDSLWADPALHQARLLREQELRLARTIMQMRAVRGATVHISRPERSPFLRDRTPTKASIVLDLKPGLTFTAADAQGLVALVAHSVEGLDPQHISIVDTEGRQLSSAKGIDADITGRLEFQQRLEASLAAKAETVLAQVLGVGNAVVRVTADIDFTATTRTETSFDPDGNVKVLEERETETTSGPSAVAAGVPGMASNVVSVSGKPNDSPLASKRELNKTQYENARIEDRLTKAPGRILRLTIAAVVHPPPGSDAAQPPSFDAASIEKIIKQAVGFDASRNDEIAVLVAPPGTTPAILSPLPAAPWWEQYERLIRAASLGMGGLAALVLGWFVLRRLRPVTIAPAPAEGLSLEAAHRLAELSQLVREQPEVAARVLATWMDEENPARQERRAA